MASIINAATSGGLISTADTSGVLQLQTAGTTAVTVDASQNVGIGTSSPNVKFQVAQSNATAVGNGSTYLGLGASENGVSGKRLIGFGYKSTNNYYPAYFGFIETFNAGSTYGDLAFYTRSVNTDTEPTERARITSAGDLFLGDTTASSGSKFWVKSNFVTQNGIGMNSTATTGTAYFQYMLYNGSGVGQITSTGTACLFTSVSDYRLKNTITPMTGALAKVAQLKPVTYKWNSDGSDGQGFIAHELAEVCPDAVVGEKDAVDADGNPKYQGIDTSFLVATLTAAIQEQQALITQLQADVATLKGA